MKQDVNINIKVLMRPENQELIRDLIREGIRFIRLGINAMEYTEMEHKERMKQWRNQKA